MPNTQNTIYLEFFLSQEMSKNIVQHQCNLFLNDESLLIPITTTLQLHIYLHYCFIIIIVGAIKPIFI